MCPFSSIATGVAVDRACVKGLLRGPEGRIAMPTLLAAVGRPNAISPETPDAIVDWQHMEADLSEALAAERPAA